jgi:hypothetical protein
MAKSSSNQGREEYVTPGWVKATVAVAVAVVVLIAVVMVTGLGGSHGPGRHMSPSSAIEHPAQ